MISHVKLMAIGTFQHFQIILRGYNYCHIGDMFCYTVRAKCVFIIQEEKKQTD